MITQIVKGTTLRTLSEVIHHVKHRNPTGRGRPYGVPGLVTKMFAEEGRRPPGRITKKMRLRLAARLDAEGIRYDPAIKEDA
jgi:hypothetical protein